MEISEWKKKKRIDKKMNELAGASHLAFMSGKPRHAQTQEKMRPPSIYEREGPNATVRKKDRSAGKKKKEKKLANPRAWIREKRGPLLTFVSERGPCTCEKSGTVRRQERKNPLLLLVGENLGEGVGEVADEAESRVSDVALLGKFPRTDGSHARTVSDAHQTL